MHTQAYRPKKFQLPGLLGGGGGGAKGVAKQRGGGGSKGVAKQRKINFFTN